ncbi:B12-binding domain-containing radical SAM protein [bacterium]|nr:B12-binding domain-containing radical SAM protein [candidate division CSSED10-310 bacterium]
MKILLFNTGGYESITPVFNKATLSAKGFISSLGLLYVATVTARSGAHDVQVHDTSYPENYPKWLPKVLQDFKPDVVGITAYSPTFPCTWHVARMTRRYAPRAHVVVGGPHTSLYPAEIAALDEVDCVVIGDGEFIFQTVMERFETGDHLGGIRGIAWKDGTRVIINDPSPPIENLDDIPFPDRTLLQGPECGLVVDPPVKTTSIITARGCPFHCTFCCQKHRPYQLRSLQNVFKELDVLIGQGYRHINVYDETFNADRKRLESFVNELLLRRYPITWTFRGMVDFFDRDIARKMSASGLRRVNLGIESASDRMLRLYNKHYFNHRELAVSVRNLRKEGIEVLGYFLVGGPTETVVEVQQTLQLAINLKLDYAQFNPLMPIPGTPVYEMASEDPAFGDYIAEYFNNPSQQFEWRFWETTIDTPTMAELISHMLRRFYFNREFLLRHMLRWSSWQRFGGQIKPALIIAKQALSSKLSRI